MMDISIIKGRRSFRTFDGRALAQKDIDTIMECARKATNPYDMNIEYRLLDASTPGLNSSVIVDAKVFLAGKMKKGVHSAEAFGYSFEQVVLCAQSLGVGTTWIAGTMNRDAFEKAMDLADDEVMPCISPLGHPAAKMSIRESLMRKAIKADSRFDFGAIFFDGEYGKPLALDVNEGLGLALEAVRLAPSAVNKQPWRVVVKDGLVHFYEQHSKGYGEKGWDVQKVDMGIALCHFKLFCPSAEFVVQNPDIVVPENCEYIASYRV